jgi:hypothetical protein
LEPIGDSLRVDAPEGALNGELRSEIAKHKSELVALLSTSTQTQGDTQGSGALFQGDYVGSNLWLRIGAAYDQAKRCIQHTDAERYPWIVQPAQELLDVLRGFDTACCKGEPVAANWLSANRATAQRVFQGLRDASRLLEGQELLQAARDVFAG